LTRSSWAAPRSPTPTCAASRCEMFRSDSRSRCEPPARRRPGRSGRPHERVRQRRPTRREPQPRAVQPVNAHGRRPGLSQPDRHQPQRNLADRRQPHRSTHSRDDLLQHDHVQREHRQPHTRELPGHELAVPARRILAAPGPSAPGRNRVLVRGAPPLYRSTGGAGQPRLTAGSRAPRVRSSRQARRDKSALGTDLRRTRERS
jgi:hypothetical protein